MPNPKEAWRVLVFPNYSATALAADLSQRWTRATISSGQHGGFKEARLSIPMSLPEAWTWLNREGAVGRHFYHITITESGRTVWEGRIHDVELQADESFQGIHLTAAGYWAAMRDRTYSASDSGNTDWAAGGPHNVGKIIRELITKSAPDINGTADVTLNERDIAGIVLTARGYPQDIILDRLAPLSDSGTGVWYYAVWEDRKPSWTARSLTQVDWYVWAADLGRLSISQQGKHLRNRILPVVGTAEGTWASDGEGTANWPIRELSIALPAGLPTTAANDARDMALASRRRPKQDQAFTITGNVYSPRILGTAAAGTLIGPSQPKWWVRAGDVIRVQDLVPASAATGTFDDLRTFFIIESVYDAGADILSIQPDRPQGRIDVLLPRIQQLERDR